MNTKDFVVLPWGKPGNSVKMKYKNARELKMEKVQLELENQEMEKKLQGLDSTLNKEKDKIESNGYHWKSGQVGKLGNRSHMMPPNKGNLIKLSAGKVKLKLLKEDIQEPVKQPVNDKMASSPASGQPKMKGKVCGQCENKAALLVCLECGEDYCSGCFAKIHQKGALKLHRTTVLQAKAQVLSHVLDVAHCFIKDVNPDELKWENHFTKEISKNHHKLKYPLLQGGNSEVEFTTSTRAVSTNQKDEVLPEGSFNEVASARSFQEVLNQWRTRNHEDNEKQKFHTAKPESTETCGVQTTLKISREPLKIEFKEDSLSYMEKLWLKKLRRIQQDRLLNMQPEDKLIQSCETTSENPFSPNASDKESDVEETKTEGSALSLPIEELKIERQEPSLKIVELDDTYQEEFEELGNVPYKVELADIDYKQSWMLYEYQKNNFPCENSIHQHYIFNKGKTDFFNLGLTNFNSYNKGTSNTDFHITSDPDDDFPAVENIQVKPFCEKNLAQESIDVDDNQKCADSFIQLERKNTLSSIGLEEPYTKEKLTQQMKESLDFNKLHEKPNFQDSENIKSQLLLEEIALRSKPITEHYQGHEKLFIFDTNERLSSLPLQCLRCSSSSTKITLRGDREWVPDHSLSSHADEAVSLDVLQIAHSQAPSRRQRRMGQTSQRTSTAKIPLSSSVMKSCSSLSSSHLPRSAASRPYSRAASEISEIEYIDATDHNELLLDSTAEQQTLEFLEKELEELRSVTDPSEKPDDLPSEELSAFNSHSLNVNAATRDFLKFSSWKDSCGFEGQSSSGKDSEVPSWLALSKSSNTDDDEEDLLDKQHVITLPGSNNH
ncbi:zinc finger B-box domain-containing protein 1 [Rhynchocyon petersi]